MNSYYTPLIKDSLSQAEEEYDYEIIKFGLFHKDPPLLNHNIFLSHFKLLFFRQGQCLVIVNDKEYRLQRGDLLLIPVNTFYTVSSAGEEAIEFYYLHFNVLPYHKIAQFSASLQLASILVLPGTVDAQLLQRCDGLNDILSRSAEGSYLCTLLLLKSILLEIRIHLADGREILPPSEHVRSSEEAIFNQSVEYLTDHLQDRVTVDELCRHCHVSQSYLYRCFRKLIALSPSQFLRQYKLQQSMQLLKMSDHSITEIAEMSGFSSIYQFSSAFKALTGQSPSQFRG